MRNFETFGRMIDSFLEEKGGLVKEKLTKESVSNTFNKAKEILKDKKIDLEESMKDLNETIKKWKVQKNEKDNVLTLKINKLENDEVETDVNVKVENNEISVIQSNKCATSRIVQTIPSNADVDNIKAVIKGDKIIVTIPLK